MTEWTRTLHCVAFCFVVGFHDDPSLARWLVASWAWCPLAPFVCSSHSLLRLLWASGDTLCAVWALTTGPRACTGSPCRRQSNPTQFKQPFHYSSGISGGLIINTLLSFRIKWLISRLAVLLFGTPSLTWPIDPATICHLLDTTWSNLCDWSATKGPVAAEIQDGLSCRRPISCVCCLFLFFSFFLAPVTCGTLLLSGHSRHWAHVRCCTHNATLREPKGMLRKRDIYSSHRSVPLCV